AQRPLDLINAAAHDHPSDCRNTPGAVWGSRGQGVATSRLVRRHSDDLAIADDLALPIRGSSDSIVIAATMNYTKTMAPTPSRAC
ncbi:MAG TPA: hypothetical protein VE462_17070, partial [Propionibacteriaceae bacterium]|nr:hypothetical protein [Propionibacteriaceae bacterium]